MDITTKYGILNNCYNISYHSNNHVADCICQKESPLTIDDTIYYPYFTENERRKLSPSVKFYPDGSIKSLYLEKRLLISTKIGEFPAELITFYPDGTLQRIFPLNGKISAYWTEENEAALLPKINFSFSCGNISIRPMCLHFYKNDTLKSLTFQPAETAEVTTSAGNLKVKCGLSFYDSEKLRSTEPAFPQKVSTPIGRITAFDPDSVDLSADTNSFCFKEDGSIAVLKTTDSITVTDNNDTQTIITPVRQSHPLNENATLTIPLTLNFEAHELTIIKSPSEKYCFNLNDYKSIVASQNSD
ncbi:hypothetical protein [Pectinatus sottacetonis]|uniref:hypothetical protein n=1 Tax=Pectinatus sottacetonis TaxID=1002795 RepID=UPI0018C7D24B|nr:hypothetical protein [Pectinatus sottacetonis]